MSTVRITKCYIEEYTNEGGGLSARLREKRSGRKVDLGHTLDTKMDLIAFLSEAKMLSPLLPGLFDRDSEDHHIRVSGDVDFDAPDEIRYLHNDNLSYLVV